MRVKAKKRFHKVHRADRIKWTTSCNDMDMEPYTIYTNLAP